MKISPAPAAGAVMGAVEGSAPAPNIRSIRMNTMRTPGLEDNPPPPQEVAGDDDKNKEPMSAAEETQPISPQFAALARQRRALQVKERALADREKALEAMSQGGDMIPKARLKSETLKVLEEAGVSYDDLTQAILANPGNAELRALEAKVASLESGVDKKLQDREAQQEQQVLAEMRREAASLIAQGEDFEMVRETHSLPDVMKLIEQTYRTSGEVLEVREALKLVEDELFARNSKLIGLKKMQGLLPQPSTPQPRAQGMRTLTNKDTASVPASAKQRAIAAFYGTLKK